MADNGKKVKDELSRVDGELISLRCQMDILRDYLGEFPSDEGPSNAVEMFDKLIPQLQTAIERVEAAESALP